MDEKQFSIRDLFLCVMLFCLGLAGCSLMKVLWQQHNAGLCSAYEVPYMLVLLLTVPAFFAAGVAAPFRAKRLGAVIGLVLGALPSGYGLLVWFLID